ncbi:MAG: polyisoprenyl-teichoic acid--peptidoglycan teichoic acid transferase, partial [Solirubrobacterales bacterium]|nr:polyisoprenyl-teichoic acid--peptidoglycan teichoic acid transferase [Solirubrobacterales bacterium]
HFPARLGPSYVTAQPADIAAAVRQFLGITGSASPRGNLNKPLASASEPSIGGKGKGKKGKKGKKRNKRVLSGSANLIDATAAGKDQGFTAKNGVFFPVYYPTKLKGGSVYAQKPHVYAILHAEGSKKFPAYKMVMRTNLGEYYGLMGTTWKNPPILRNPSETKRIRGKTYMLFYDNDRLRLVGWRSKGASYWLNNTLLETLSEREMMSIATTMGVTKTRRR